jgi:alpha-ribazole phosphatase
MKIFAIRHTQVTVDSGVCYGQSDVAVAGTFEAEKNKTLLELRRILPVDKVFSSPLTRCKMLAEALFQNEEINFDKRLKELCFGDWEMKYWDEIYCSSEGKKWMENYHLLPTLNGESYAEMKNRIEIFLDDLKKAEYAKVAVVTHAGVIRIMKSLIEKQPLELLFGTYRPDFGSITEFEI